MRSPMSRWLLAAALVVASTVPALAAGQGWLGVTTQATDEDLRRGLDLTRDGLLVNQVSADSPADHAGLRKGDVLLSFGGRTVTQPEDLRQLVRDTEPGRTVPVAVWRNGGVRTLQVKVGELPEAESFDAPTPPSAPRAPRAPRAPSAPGEDGDMHRRVIINGREIPEDEIDDQLKDMHIEGLKDLEKLKGMSGLQRMAPGSEMFLMPPGRGRLGVRVEKLSSDLAQALGADGDEGVLVLEVLEDTPAQRAGLRAGDVIVRVGDEAVSDPGSLVRSLGDRDGKVDVVVVRKGARRTVSAQLEKRSEPSWRSTPSGEPRIRREIIRIPEPGQGPRGYREQTKSDDADLREELRQLRQELRELRQQMGDKK